MRFGTFIPIILYITKPLFLSPNSYKLALSSPTVSQKAVFLHTFCNNVQKYTYLCTRFQREPPLRERGPIR